MKVLPLVFYPDKRLQKPSAKVDIFDQSLSDLATAMAATMYANSGVGLAAPQIGQNIRLIVVTDNKGGYIAYVNPELTFGSKEKVMSEEGCLSIPNVNAVVPRHAKIRWRYQTLTGEKKQDKARGLTGIIVQHEIDHINGILILDRATKITTTPAEKADET